MWDSVLGGMQAVFTLNVLGVIILASALGVTIGAIPGLTATMGVALLVPLTFFMDDVSAMAAIIALTASSIYAGDIPGTLVRMPGTPASGAYTDDAYRLTLRGRHREALAVSLIFSVVGGLLGAVVLISAAPQLAFIATWFTTYEYFWLVALGLTCAAVVSRDSALKGGLSLTIGLLLATVGLSEVHARPRFTFGLDPLISGISFIPAMIGLFGGSEVLRNSLHFGIAGADGKESKRPEFTDVLAAAPEEEMSPWWLVWHWRWQVLRSSAIGTLIGMLPGAGADIAAWISYAVAKRFSKRPQDFGRGSLEGVADATGANNAALAGAWIPALVFGIPGDSVTAIVIGVLMMKNITPGPDIFTDPKRSVLVGSLYVVFILANILLLPIGAIANRAGGLLVRTPRSLLLPAILIFSIVGAYAINGSLWDVGIMMAMSLLGFLLEEYGVPVGPLVLGLILGGKLEETFVQNLSKTASPLAFFQRPVSAVLSAVCIAIWVAPLLWRWLRSSSKPASDS